MPTISETITIPAPPDDVWPLLSDPALVAACIPGATLSPDREGDAWKGSIRVKFGPTVAVFKGEATLTYDHTARTCTIAGRGIDGRGASRALANGIVKASGDKAGGDVTTTLHVDGDYNVTGPLETFANAGGVHVARALLAEFSTNMAKMVAAKRPAPVTVASTTAMSAEPAPAAGAAPGVPTGPDAVTQIRAPVTAKAPVTENAFPVNPIPAAAAELSAGKIVWAAFLSWLRSLFGKRT